MTKILYHNDADGVTAGAIVYRKLWPTDNDIQCYAVDYHEPFPLDEIGKDELVWILDYCIPVEDLERLLNKTNDITFIDHHEGSMMLEKYPQSIKGLRGREKSGCELVWDYCFPDKYVPWTVRYIGDRDTWKWIYGDDTRYFYNAFQLIPNLKPDSAIWDILLIPSMMTITEMISNGKIIETYKENLNAKLVKSWAYETVFEGYPCLAINAPKQIDSLPAEMLKSGHPIIILYTYDGSKYTVDLRTKSKDINVAKIAQKYGGDGHPPAAGFIIDHLPFRGI